MEASTPLPSDWREFIELLNSHGVEYVVIGAHARAFHGIPRSTMDIDFFVRRSPENAVRIENALRAFGFASLGLRAADFEKPDRVVQLGAEPNRIDLITSISGVSFDEVWEDRIQSKLDGIPVSFISLSAYKKNKRAAGRPKDLADLDAVTAD